MQLWLSDHFDGPAWLGDDEMSKPVVGRLPAGPHRLAQRMALELGIDAPAPRARRVAQLAGLLLQTPGFWSRSAEVAAVDVARRLIDLMDELVLGGWDGVSGPGRLRELASIREELEPGAGDVLVRAAQLVPQRTLRWSSAVVDEGHVAPVVLRLLEAMRSRGLIVEPLRISRANAASVTLLEPGSVLEGAEVTAEWLGSHLGTIVVGYDRALDAALDRLGLPTLGSPAPSGATAIVRAFLGHASEQSAASALAALSCAPNPVPAEVRSQLLNTLGDWPSVASPRWQETLGVAGELATDVLSADRARVLGALTRWARSSGSAVADGVLAICEELDALWAAAGGILAAHDEARLLDLVDEPVVSLFDAQAGYFPVDDAGAVVGACERLLVWRPTELPASRWLWTDEESAFLAEHGVRPWRAPDALARALEQAGHDVVVVCPRVDDEGRDAPTHPLVASLRERAASQLPPGARATIDARARPIPNDRWMFPRGLPRRDAESPHSIGHLIGCSFRHAARYGLRLVPTGTVLADGPLLYGRLVHEALHQAHARAPDADVSGLGARALDWLAGDGRALCPELFAPSRRHDQDAVVHATQRAAELVATLCAELGLRIIASEEQLASASVLHADHGGARLEGRPDLVLGPDPVVVIDFKWSLGQHRDLLRAGVAHQLGLYAAMVRESLPTGSPPPAVGYLALRQGLLVVDRDIGSRHVQVLEAPPVETTVAAVAKTTRHRLEELDAGFAIAPGTHADVPGPALVGDEIQLSPPCGFCSYSVLCGRAFGVLVPKEDA
jgi:hypothetical protein